MNEQPLSTCAYFDGYSMRRREVTLKFDAALDIFENGAFIAAWLYGDIRRLPSSTGALRLRSVSAPKSAYLEIYDLGLAEEAQRQCRLLGGEPPPDTRQSRQRLGVAALATFMAGAFLWGGVPRMAGVIAPIIPVEWEKKLGEAADEQVRQTYSGAQCHNPKGVAALKKFSDRLQDAAHLRLPATIEVITSKTPNAFALPGGKVYLLSALLAKSQTQDETLGVLAHELGHLENRDHLRRVIAAGGTALLVGMIFGDVTGGGAMIAIGNSLLSAAHSREAESKADDFAVQTLARLGRPTKPMGELLLRITGAERDGLLTILHDHPVSEDRLAKLASVDKGALAPPLLTDQEWKALQAICEETKEPPKPRALPL